MSSSLSGKPVMPSELSNALLAADIGVTFQRWDGGGDRSGATYAILAAEATALGAAPVSVTRTSPTKVSRPRLERGAAHVQAQQLRSLLRVCLGQHPA